MGMFDSQGKAPGMGAIQLTDDPPPSLPSINLKERVMQHEQRILALEQERTAMLEGLTRLVEVLKDQFGLML